MPPARGQTTRAATKIRRAAGFPLAEDRHADRPLPCKNWPLAFAAHHAVGV